MSNMIMLTALPSTPSVFCGKPLWTNLWIMWKSWVFPQVNPGIPDFPAAKIFVQITGNDPQ